VSTEGGFEPIFSKTGDRIFYRNGRLIMSVPFSGGAQPVLGKPIEYVAYDFADFVGRAWMLAPDGDSSSSCCRATRRVPRFGCCRARCRPHVFALRADGRRK
jgi:hypothetical protein